MPGFLPQSWKNKSKDLGNRFGGTLFPMSAKRSYQEACGIPRALDRIGERWSLMVVRELMLGPKRFTDLRTGLPHVGPDVLSQRLRDLDAGGIVRRRTLPPPAAA